jgi:methyltransferase (TIGR00027 family)
MEGAAFGRAAGRFERLPEFRNPDDLAARMGGPLVRLALFPGIRQALARLYDSNFPGAYALHIARTKHVDALVERELAAGASQLVTLGAAFDTRSYRFANWLAKAAVFEVDYAATLECKSRRLRTAATRGPALQRIALDMNEAEFAAPLRAAGYDPRRRTVFVWEGITPYRRGGTSNPFSPWLRPPPLVRP